MSESKIRSLREAWLPAAEEFLVQLRASEITHGLMIYRKVDGSVAWRAFGDSDVYILGLVEVFKKKLMDEG